MVSTTLFLSGAQGEEMALATKDEEQLLERFKEGDSQAFILLVERWERPMFLYLRAFMGPSDELEDLIQQTFLKVWSQRSQLTSSFFKAWIFKIARNLTLDYLRQKKRKKNLEGNLEENLEWDFQQIEEGVALEEERKMLKKAIGEVLSKREQEVIYLSYFADLSDGEIADLLSLQVQTIYSTRYNSLKKLKDHFEKESLDS